LLINVYGTCVHAQKKDFLDSLNTILSNI
jgi:hypothetical protein